MTETYQSSSTSITSPIGPSITPMSETNLAPVTNHKLNGHNYLQWSQSVMMFINGKGRDDYLTGAVVQPNTSDANYKLWGSENNMVMSLLINSMTMEISESFLLYSTVQEIWEATMRHTSVLRILQSYLKWKVCFRISNKEMHLLPFILPISFGIGSSWIYSRPTTVSVRMMVQN